MRGAHILPQEEQKALLRETYRFYNNFLGYAHVPPHENQEEEADSSGDSDHHTDVSQLLGGYDDYSDEPTLRPDTIERTMYGNPKKLCFRSKIRWMHQLFTRQSGKFAVHQRISCKPLYFNLENDTERAERSKAEKEIHMGPRPKKSFMQMKW